MRSELVFAARQTLGNRFALCQATAKAARIFHRARTRVEETTNEVLQRIAESEREALTLRCDNDLTRREPDRAPRRNPRSTNLLGEVTRNLPGCVVTTHGSRSERMSHDKESIESTVLDRVDCSERADVAIPG